MMPNVEEYRTVHACGIIIVVLPQYNPQTFSKEHQGDKAYWEDNENYLAFAGEEVCITIKTLGSSTERASSATATRIFELVDIVNPADLGLKWDVAHIVTGEVKDFVNDKAVVSSSIIKGTITKMRHEIIEITMNQGTTTHDVFSHHGSNILTRLKGQYNNRK